MTTTLYYAFTLCIMADDPLYYVLTLCIMAGKATAIQMTKNFIFVVDSVESITIYPPRST